MDELLATCQILYQGYVMIDKCIIYTASYNASKAFVIYNKDYFIVYMHPSSGMSYKSYRNHRHKQDILSDGDLAIVKESMMKFIDESDQQIYLTSEYSIGVFNEIVDN